MNEQYETSPNTDGALRSLLEYLHAGITARYPGAIASLSPCDRFPDDAGAYPHLALYSVSGEGGKCEINRGVICRYALPHGDTAKLPGQFYALQKTVFSLLAGYYHPQGWVEIPSQSFRYRNFILASSNRVLSFFEIEFEIVDRVPLSAIE